MGGLDVRFIGGKVRFAGQRALYRMPAAMASLAACRLG